jgi:clan AA aspartic protease (TIGR02281 family)
MADQTAIFDAGPFKLDKTRRDAFLKSAERFFDQEAANAQDGQFTLSGRTSTDDGSARSRYLQEIENLKREVSRSREDRGREQHSDPLLEAQREAAERQFSNHSLPRRSSELASVFGVGLGLILLAVAMYGYRDAIGNVADPLVARLIPSLGYSTDPQTVSYFADTNGQFAIDARANGIWFRFIVDTGASGIVFSKADARRLGFVPETLRFDHTAWTANGWVRLAGVRLQRLEIGPIVMNDLPAQINDGELLQPLLGMEFLKRMSAIEIKNGTLTIHNNITPAEYRQRQVLVVGEPHDGVDPQPAPPSDRLVPGGPFETPALPPLNWSGFKSGR